MEKDIYARIVEKNGVMLHQQLVDHLYGVADRARIYAADFCSSEWAYLVGLWHDLGKYQSEFQDKLKGANSNVEHSGFGAALALDRFKEKAIPIAYSIAGHHTGLANRVESGVDLPLPLMERIRQNQSLISQLIDMVPEAIVTQNIPELPEYLKRPAGNQDKIRNIEFWTRFLFSALVDADRLDAEYFDDPAKQERRAGYLGLTMLDERLDSYIQTKIKSIPADRKKSAVNRVRQEVLEACKKMAMLRPGIFSLNVPTGGGKTLSAMSFAVKHAQYNELKRVIVVIPYTSIIEQNAAVYKEAFGSENVIEHHSTYDPENEKSETEIGRYNLAVENWDAPVIVTTSVQFFETLFSSKPSVCRKLHNIARSVIILDEVQTLPPGLLDCILEAINELVSNYNCSCILATATSPALAERSDFPKGLKSVKSIVREPRKLAMQLCRVQYFWPDKDEVANWPDLAAKLASEKQVLAIVDRRKDARDLARELIGACDCNTVFHISALMCPAHRLEIIQRIIKCLEEGKDCRVVSTQVVEAGVDLDFPVVYRALTGLSSIVQAAGRCNREGKLDTGRLFIFKPPHEPPVGILRTSKQIAESMLKCDGKLDIEDPETMERYFRKLYFTQELDKYGIQGERNQLNYANVSIKFKLIEDGFTSSVVVPYGRSAELLTDIRQNGINRSSLRRLQRYMVSVYPDSIRRLGAKGVLEEIAKGIYAVEDMHLYNPVYGLIMEDGEVALPQLIV